MLSPIFIFEGAYLKVMIKIHEVQAFVCKRFPVDNNWLNGNCYWFAHILCERFPELDIYYDPIVGHFYAGNGKVFYDWSGVYFGEEYEHKCIKLSVIHTKDPLWYARLIRDCKN